MKIQVDKKLLYDLYINKELSAYKIANIMGHSMNTIGRRLREYNIRIRTNSESHRGSHHNYFGKKRPKHSKKMTGKGNPMYGKIFSKKHRKKMRENHANVSGKNNPMYNIHLYGKLNPNWRNGISRNGYPYKFNMELKEKIRKRDEHTCQLCNKKRICRKLDVHHIDYDKENLDPKNLIGLCRKCNVKVNYNRKHWKKYFQAIIKEKMTHVKNVI